MVQAYVDGKENLDTEYKYYVRVPSAQSHVGHPVENDVSIRINNSFQYVLLWSNECCIPEKNSHKHLRDHLHILSLNSQLIPINQEVT